MNNPGKSLLHTVDGCEVLNQLVDGLSRYNIIACSVSYLSIISKSYQLVQEFFHPQYQETKACRSVLFQGSTADGFATPHCKHGRYKCQQRTSVYIYIYVEIYIYIIHTYTTLHYIELHYIP